MKTIFLLLLFVVNSVQLFAQSDSLNTEIEILEMAEVTTIGIATGIHISQYPMIEIGYFKHTTFEFPMTFGGSYTIESYFLKDFILAPKVNYWMNISFINIGTSLLWYVDFNGESSLKIRPEIGFGYKNFKINYSKNISMTNKEMEYIGTHFVSLNYFIGLIEK